MGFQRIQPTSWALVGKYFYAFSHPAKPTFIFLEIDFLNDLEFTILAGLADHRKPQQAFIFLGAGIQIQVLILVHKLLKD